MILVKETGDNKQFLTVNKDKASYLPLNKEQMNKFVIYIVEQIIFTPYESCAAFRGMGFYWVLLYSLVAAGSKDLY